MLSYDFYYLTFLLEVRNSRVGFTCLKSEAWAAFLLKAPGESDSFTFSFLGCCPCHDLFLYGQGQLCSIFICLHGHVSFSSSDCPPIAYI